MLLDVSALCSISVIMYTSQRSSFLTAQTSFFQNDPYVLGPRRGLRSLSNQGEMVRLSGQFLSYRGETWCAYLAVFTSLSIDGMVVEVMIVGNREKSSNREVLPFKGALSLNQAS